MGQQKSMRDIERDIAALDARAAAHNTSTTQHAHSSEHNEHYTPAWLVDAARYVVNGFTLDPFSSPVANETVKAQEFWTLAQWGTMPENVYRVLWQVRDGAGGLSAPRVWCNPPGGRLNADTLEPLPRNENGKQGGPGLSSAGAAFAKLSHEWRHGRVDCALFLCFSLNVFRTAQSKAWAPHFPQACAPTSFPFVCFRDRIHFDTVDENGNVQHGAGGGAPQDSALVLLPSHINQADMLGRFKEAFSPYGHVRL
jgi:hypothetical protein